MSRLKFLKQVVSTEDKIQAIYNEAKREIARLPMELATRTKAMLIMAQADKDVEKLIYDSIRRGAEAGEAEGRKQALEEMMKKWKG